MGGFYLSECSSEKKSEAQYTSQEDDVPLHLLLVSDLTLDDISFTMLTEAEIKDRGKSNWLAKSLVLLQMSWFVMQCIARGIKHLPVTHLEIVTLAYAAMNFMIYIFWWNKPLNINWPVQVFQKSEPRETQPQITEPKSEAAWEAFVDGLRMVFMFIIGAQDDNVNMSHEDRVPRFWANSAAAEQVTADLIMLGVGVCFGAIHCIAWHFTFLTHTELSMWRVSSIAITALPVYVPMVLFLGDGLGNMGFENFALTILIFGGLSGAILYIIAQVVTLVLAFTSLRDLPAYYTLPFPIMLSTAVSDAFTALTSVQ